MELTTTESTPTADTGTTVTLAVRILRLIDERLEGLGADIVNLMNAMIKGDVEAMRELETAIRDLYGWAPLDVEDKSAPAVLLSRAAGQVAVSV